MTRLYKYLAIYDTNYYAEKAHTIWNTAKAECPTHRLPSVT